MPPKPKPLEDRFWLRVNKTESCWLWIGYIDSDGYGRIGLGGKGGKVDRAHRVSWRLCVGEIPAGLTLDHLCRIRACVNPKHLEPVTLEENKRRGFSPAAINARRTDKTHCHRGHLYRNDTDRIRGCTECRIEWDRRRRAKSR